MELGLGEGGYAKPGEVLKLIMGEKYDEYMMHAFHRKAMYRVDENNETISVMDL